MISATYIDHMGDDDRIADAARVSFAKLAANFSPAQNARLIHYLAEHGHFTPFAHPQITLHIKAPIFVARQLQKHQVGLVWNEVSRRYVDGSPEFFQPTIWRGRPSDKKQGSSNIKVFSVALADGEITSPSLLAEDVCRYAREAYDALIKGGVAPEQARMVLPLSAFTEWYWTGSLAAWARVCRQRLAKDSQAETAEVAHACAAIIAPLFPTSWPALMGATAIAEESAA